MAAVVRLRATGVAEPKEAFIPLDRYSDGLRLRVETYFRSVATSHRYETQAGRRRSTRGIPQLAVAVDQTPTTAAIVRNPITTRRVFICDSHMQRKTDSATFI